MPIYFGRQKVSYQQKIGGGEIIPVPTPSTPSTGKKAVNFYDYDGTLLHSYTREEALELSELPSLPDRTSDGLTCQGWNYTLENIKNDLTTNTSEDRWIDVGATYITTDGATHINITFANKYRNKMPLMFIGDVTIDWGDGNTQAVNHTYATVVTHEYEIAQSYPAKYTIKLTVNSGTLTFGISEIISSYNICGSTEIAVRNPYSSRIDSVFIGNNVTSIGDSAFYGCYALTSIMIPNSVTSIGTYAFGYCYSLASITIPDSVTSIDYNAFYFCSSLASISIPDGVTSIECIFSNCYSLASITIPDSVTSINSNTFQYCYSLTSVTIPNSVTSINNHVFSDCYSLTSVTIPNSVTSIYSNTFACCYSLTSVTISNSVKSISTFAFTDCYGIIKYDFSTHTSVPTLSNTNAFNGIASDAKIVVPDALYTKWIAATNWSRYASYIVKVSEYEEP